MHLAARLAAVSQSVTRCETLKGPELEGRASDSAPHLAVGLHLLKVPRQSVSLVPESATQCPRQPLHVPDLQRFAVSKWPRSNGLIGHYSAAAAPQSIQQSSSPAAQQPSCPPPSIPCDAGGFFSAGYRCDVFSLVDGVARRGARGCNEVYGPIRSTVQPPNCSEVVR